MSTEMDYEDIRDSLKSLPITWYPGLLVALVQESYKAGVWKPFGASTAVRALEGSNGNMSLISNVEEGDECKEDCRKCTGEYCETHTTDPCDCDVVDRHRYNPGMPAKIEDVRKRAARKEKE